ncbi:class II histone deacetylase [Pseudomonas frederiksbergensis]|uniref:class II histone deacetylase n=1 Tax=Pseudomonas frederiksbergensis TaxID=104087 RepID=UPI000F474C81|nr:class II histone deacetylase [Pseudomonas frederiksbergensis]RON48317.1 class II histone deacetylase [Pseudomonas frederiksbergensis]
MKTGFVWHEIYMWHSTGCHAGVYRPGLTIQPGIPFEEAQTKRRLKNLLDVSGLSAHLQPITAVALTEEQLQRVHTSAYLNVLKQLSDGNGGQLSANTPVGNGSYDIAKLAAGGVVSAVDAVLRGAVKNAYALVRPPGHHAEPDTGMGFCLLANAALAADHALEHFHLERVAIVDWDVHHGNGAQRIFWEDPRVLTISVHQDGNYPADSGHTHEQGAGPGLGYNFNIPLPPGCGNGAYLHAFDTLILPALRAYRPQLIIVPCGFDAGAYDPLGRMMLHSNTYRAMTQRVMAVADACCEGRLVLCHEGGYEPNTVPYMGLAVIETLSELPTAITDPNLADMQGLTGQALKPHQREWIARLLNKLQGPLLPGPEEEGCV